MKEEIITAHFGEKVMVYEKPEPTKIPKNKTLPRTASLPRVNLVNSGERRSCCNIRGLC